MINLNYVYFQLSKEITEDEPRILIGYNTPTNDPICNTLYISDLTSDENIILNQYLDMIRNKIESGELFS